METKMTSRTNNIQVDISQTEKVDFEAMWDLIIPMHNNSMPKHGNTACDVVQLDG